MTVVAMREYESLTKETVISLAIELSLFSSETPLVCEEIGDGNLNYVFRVTDGSGEKGIIIKQALPYAKVIGESWPLTLKRAKIEASALQKHGEYAVGLVPIVYATDESLAITIMEDLSHLEIVREGLIKGKSYPKLSTDIGEYLALTLFNTSDFALHPFEKKSLVVEFSNPELCKITEDLIFTNPFFDHETNDFEPALQAEVEAIWNNNLLKLEVAKLKRSFLTEAEALLHGDLHTGSIFASEAETKVIDPEFAFYGPIGFDIGLFLGNLIVQSFTRQDDQRDAIHTHIQNTWNTFCAKFSECWKKGESDLYKSIEGYEAFVLEKIFHDSVGFAGCELIRRTIGLAHVKDLDSIENHEKRILTKKQTLKAGKRLIVSRHDINTIDAVIELLGEIQ